MPLSIIILAAGQGTRMKSSRPKVMHEVAGKPMLQHVVDTSVALDPDQIIVVVGHHSAQVREQIDGQSLNFVEQAEQLGTGKTRWKSALFRVKSCSRFLSAPLQNDIRFFHHPLPASL